MDFEEFSKKIVQCRAESSKLPTSESAFDLLLPDSFNIQKKIIALVDKKIIGWKLGGTNKASRDATGFFEIFWGPLFDKTIFTTSEILNDPLLLGAEVEVALKLSDQFNIVDLSNLTKKNYSEIFSQVALAIELPCSVATNGSGGVIVADLCASGYAVISEPIQYFDYNSSSLAFDVYLNGKLILSGEADHSSEKFVIDFIKSSYSKGFSIEAGQWIIAGGLTPLIKVRSADIILVKSTLFESISVSFN